MALRDTDGPSWRFPSAEATITPAKQDMKRLQIFEASSNWEPTKMVGRDDERQSMQQIRRVFASFRGLRDNNFVYDCIGMTKSIHVQKKRYKVTYTLRHASCLAKLDKCVSPTGHRGNLAWLLSRSSPLLTYQREAAEPQRTDLLRCVRQEHYRVVVNLTPT